MTEPPSRKGASRKAELLDATLRIIARDGLAGLSMRGLAAEAGTPLGAVSYYFAGKDELVEAAFARHSEIEGARMQAMIASLASGTPDEMANAVTDFVVEGCTVRRRQLITEYELMVESARRPALQELTAGWLRSLRAQMVEVMTALGSADPEIDARLLLAVISGLEVDSLADEPGPSRRLIIHSMIRQLEDSSFSWASTRGTASDRNRAKPTLYSNTAPRDDTQTIDSHQTPVEDSR